MKPGLDKDVIACRVSHYVIVRLIGVGGMGKVYLARDEQLRRHVAIKVLVGTSDETAAPHRLLSEARFLSQAVHPYVAAVYDFICEAEREYIVMEFVPGATLKEVLAAGPLPGEDVIRLGLQMTRGIAAAHAARVLHRDLKPQNIKITPAGQVKILDFGVASMIAPRRFVDDDNDSGTSSSAHAAGTVPYMSPEQLRGDALDERSDIFSLGALLYEMAAGRPAFPQQPLAPLVEAIQYDDPVPLAVVNPLAAAGLERIVTKAMEKDPDRRYRGAMAMANDLRALRAPATRDRSEPARPDIHVVPTRFLGGATGALRGRS